MRSGGGWILKAVVAAIITAAAVSACAWGWLKWSHAHSQGQAGSGGATRAGEANSPSGGIQEIVEANRGSANHPAQPATGSATTQPSLTREEAAESLQQGRALLKDGKLLGARASLCRAFFSGRLTADEEAQSAKDLSALADKTIFSRELMEGDPYVTFYVVKPGDHIEGPGGIEMTQHLHVPAALILKVNGLASGSSLRQGRTIKLIKGPFNAIVYKLRFLMDVYLKRDNLETVLVRRIPVGLGRNGSTPIGAWRVRQGRKIPQPPYYASEGSGLPVGTRILYGEPGYPFGKKGLWISLEGMDQQTAPLTDFGIHSTNDANSIGKANSLGCVRMADDDIDLVNSLLYEVHSRVDVVP